MKLRKIHVLKVTSVRKKRIKYRFPVLIFKKSDMRDSMRILFVTIEFVFCAYTCVCPIMGLLHVGLFYLSVPNSKIKKVSPFC